MTGVNRCVDDNVITAYLVVHCVAAGDAAHPLPSVGEGRCSIEICVVFDNHCGGDTDRETPTQGYMT